MSNHNSVKIIDKKIDKKMLDNEQSSVNNQKYRKLKDEKI